MRLPCCPGPWPEDLPEIKRYAILTKLPGVLPAGVYLEFPLLEANYAALPDTVRRLRHGEYACVHPGARLASRRWGRGELRARRRDTLASHGLRIVLTESAEETGLTQAVAQLMRNPSLDFAGCTSLGAVAALLSRARLLICNNTGVSHIAAVLQLPSVVICCGSDPAGLAHTRTVPLAILAHQRWARRR
jgi:ADP-heptose:LPS heptosyltransferase